MSFNSYQYTRPDLDIIGPQLEELTKSFVAAESMEAQEALLLEVNTIAEDYATMQNLCLIRHTINTQDKFYEAENTYFDQKGPDYEALRSKFYKALKDSRFRAGLEKKHGKQLFTIVETSLLSFSPEIIDNLKRENELSTAYTKIKANAKIDFDGKTLNLSTITPYRQDPDRNTRKKAIGATWDFYEQNKPELAKIFDELIQERTKMAKKLGFSSYVELGYLRLNRSGYTPKMIKTFRAAIRKHVVPLATELYKRQATRLDLDELKYCDEGFSFKTGNPKPQGKPDWIVGQARKMYQSLSKETAAFFDFMEGQGLMDLEAREGKATGGYCTYISNHRAPFIFSNFNGTSGDIDVLTHEAGHAFQVYSSSSR